MFKKLSPYIAGPTLAGASLSVLLGMNPAQAAPCVTTSLSTIGASASGYVCEIGDKKFTFGTDVDDFGGLGDVSFTTSGSQYNIIFNNFGNLINPVTAFDIGVDVLNPANEVINVFRIPTVGTPFTVIDDTLTNTPFPYQSGTIGSTFEGTGTLTALRFEINQQPVPGPLPILGVGAAFGFSRKLRKRIKHSL
jgi:hypothetical protein